MVNIHSVNETEDASQYVVYGQVFTIVPLFRNRNQQLLLHESKVNVDLQLKGDMDSKAYLQN